MVDETKLALTDRVKAETWELHGKAEHHDFQESLGKGTISREGYIAYLGQMLLIHEALEKHLRTLAATDSTVASIVQDYQYQEPYLRADLEHFGVEASLITPCVGTQALIEHFERLAETNPIGLLGAHYVVEGSNNGSKFIAKSIRDAFDLDEDGVRYLDPYGKLQRAYWGDFKTALTAAAFSADDADAFVASAKAMYVAIYKVADELGEMVGGGEACSSGSVSTMETSSGSGSAAPKCPFHEKPSAG